jgi:hypothetical protein
MNSGYDSLQWRDLFVERRASPVPLDDTGFREWMSGRRIFVSSPMDDEMLPARQAIRSWLEKWDAVPVMWESITPRDQRADIAYIEGVDSSAVFVLAVGKRYGIPDWSGYSPTHREANQAQMRGIPRLLFVRGDVSDAERDGKLNDWIKGLYNELSAAVYDNSEGLCRQLDRQLREIAAQHESMWLKLGPLVFPGHIDERRSGNESLVSISARVGDGDVRRELSSLGRKPSRVRADRLTYLTDSKLVTVRDVSTSTQRTSASSVSITCVQLERGGGASSLGGMTINTGGRSYSPTDQVELWAQEVVFGVVDANLPPSPPPLWGMWRDLESETLPQLLKKIHAHGWMAEGLTRLFIVENLIAKFGGHFVRMDVGSASGSGVRVKVGFAVDGAQRPATFEGIVPLR